MLTESRADETIIYAAQPAVVAEACQKAIAQLGRVTQVSRETGTIAGKLGSIWVKPVFINLRISRHEQGTELHIQTQRKGGPIYRGRGPKRPCRFPC